jgi:16S rRNA (guanine527-N7)-methyltransferase
VKRPPGQPGERLARLAARHELDVEATATLSRFLDLLAADPHAPTAVRDPGEGAHVHLADSLSALPMLDEALGTGLPPHVADLGSGAGLPGVPLSVARPALHVDLVEATGRKCDFLRRAVAALRLPNVEVRCARAEELPAQGFRDAYGAVVVRAVAPLATLVEYAGPLLVHGGALIAWKGRRDPDEERAGAQAGAEIGLEPLEVRQVSPFEQSGNRHRHLHLYRKVRPCPPGFPRRPGMARKKPLA